MGLMHRETNQEKAAKKAAAQAIKAEAAEFKARLPEFRRARDKALGTGRFTKWPNCMACGNNDGWYAVGSPRHVRAPSYSRWWTGGSSTIPTRRFACVHCGARADLVQETQGFFFLHT